MLFILQEQYNNKCKIKPLKHMLIVSSKNIDNQTRKLHLFRIISFILLFITSITLQAQDHKIITAKSGDGIYQVLRDNQIPLSYFNEFLELNNDKLKGSKELKTGTKYKLPVVGGDKKRAATGNNISSSGKPIQRFTIFGTKYQDVVIENNELKGAVFHLISGHGGPDPGAVGKYNGKMLCEDEYAYDITLRLVRNLISKGATVYIIIRDPNDGIRDGWYLAPDKDEVCYPNLPIPINHMARLRQRVEAVNKLYKKHRGKYQRLIDIHVDSRSTRENIDVFFYHDKGSISGKKLATNLRDTFDKKYNQHQPGRGYRGTVSDRNLYVLKYSAPVATLIELGNINHERDIRRIIIDDNRQAVANWLTEGLIVDFKNSL